MISLQQYIELANFGLDYILKNQDSLDLVKNESGFVRATIPFEVPLEIPNQKKRICKIRFNFWSPEADLEVQEESVHTHPRAFESCILNGGYTHRLYEHSNEGTDYQTYKVTKSNSGKTAEFFGKSSLKVKEDETVEKGNTVYLPIELIHKIVTTKPKTLTINAVLEGEEDESSGNDYFVFLSEKADESSIVTERRSLCAKKEEILEDMIKILGQYMPNEKKEKYLA